MKTPADYQREYRERKRKAVIADAAPEARTFRSPFFEFFQHQLADAGITEFAMHFDAMGIDAPDFIDDSGPKSRMGALEDYQHFSGYERSIGRAEAMVTSLIEAAGALATMIADYKRAEIMARITEIQAADLSDADAKKQAFADMARLNKMLDQLNKQVRMTFPQWKVTGK